MASLAKSKRSGKTVYRIWVGSEPNRKAIWLGAVSKTSATLAHGYISDLERSIKGNSQPEASTELWLAQIDEKMTSKLVKAGLISKRPTPSSYQLDAFVSDYIDTRLAWAPNTVRNFHQTRKKLVSCFGADHDIREFNQASAEHWEHWMRSQTKKKDDQLRWAEATISKTIKRAKQIFDYAIKSGYLSENPFHELRATGELNRSRMRYVEPTDIGEALKVMPLEWQLIIVLCRFNALRCPSELMALRWEHVNFETLRITIESSKTRRHPSGYRVAPIFPEVLPLLQRQFEAAGAGVEHVITSNRGDNANLRTQFLRYLKRAGVESWPRLFHNLRASAKMDLVERFPAHVVSDWTGSTVSIDEFHYLTTRADHFTMAQSVAPRVAVGSESVADLCADNGGNRGK